MWHDARLRRQEQALFDQQEYDAKYDEDTGLPWVQRWSPESPTPEDQPEDDGEIITITDDDATQPLDPWGESVWENGREVVYIE